MKTKFGSVRINNKGYYQIVSKKEGNHGELLHRLIYEDFYGNGIPRGYVIHHKNGNKLDNCILNLQLMGKEDHVSLHNSGVNNPMFGKTHSEETKIKMSMAQNTTGYLNVYKHKNKNCKQGFEWCYQYYDENGKKKSLYSVDIKKLEQKVKAQGLKWMELNM